MATIEGGTYIDQTKPMAKGEEIKKHLDELKELNLTGNPHDPNVLTRKRDLEKRIAQLLENKEE